MHYVELVGTFGAGQTKAGDGSYSECRLHTINGEPAKKGGNILEAINAFANEGCRVVSAFHLKSRLVVLLEIDHWFPVLERMVS